MLQQRGQAPPDPEIKPHRLVVRIGVVHIIAFHVGDHLEGQFVMVAQEQPPLAGGRNLRSLRQDFCDGFPVFQLESHEHARHEREMEGHVELVACSEVGAQVGGPLIGFGQQHAAGILAVEFGAQFFNNDVGFRQVFARGAFALD